MRQYLSFVFIIILSLCFGSCKQEGCTDSKANNYNSDAKKECDCCQYDGSVVFWTAPNNALFLAGCTYVAIYVDGVMVGSMPTNSTINTPPACGTTGVTYEAALGSSTSKTIQYEIKNATINPQGDFVVYSGSILLHGGECGSYQMQ